jgi:pyruvyltransferase
VRGFLTKALVLRDAGINVPVIGDPGLLLSDFYPLPKKKIKKPLGFIIHKVDREKFLHDFPYFENLIIDNYLEPKAFVEQLSEYSAVASTSLHGCVFCHSYGIPVKPFYLTDQVIGGDFKFSDYYSSLGFDVVRECLSNEMSDVDILQKVVEFYHPTSSFVDLMKKNQTFAIKNHMLEL